MTLTAPAPTAPGWLALPGARHTIAITITPGIGHPDVRFTCSGRPGETWCQAECPEGCDEVPCAHTPQVTPCCSILAWLVEDPWGTYCGDDNVALGGGPIAVEWQGDSYGWRYATWEESLVDRLSAIAR